MNRLHNITAIALTGIVGFSAVSAPIVAAASETGKKNTTIALGAAALGLLLTQHNKLPGILAAGGAAYAYSQYNKDVRNRHRNDRYGYNRNGYNYNRNGRHQDNGGYPYSDNNSRSDYRRNNGNHNARYNNQDYRNNNDKYNNDSYSSDNRGNYDNSGDNDDDRGDR